jgi:hypothetical protein
VIKEILERSGDRTETSKGADPCGGSAPLTKFGPDRLPNARDRLTTPRGDLVSDQHYTDDDGPLAEVHEFPPSGYGYTPSGQLVELADDRGTPPIFGGYSDSRDSVASEVKRLRVREEARKIFEREKRGEPGERVFDQGTLSEILARSPQPAARIDQLIPWEGNTLITAQRKTGKTTFLGNLARSLLTGEPFLDQFEVSEPVPKIAYLNYEMPGGMLAAWFDHIGVPPDRIKLINLRGERNPLDTLQDPEPGMDDPILDHESLASEIATFEAECLMIDPFGVAYSGKSENDPGEVRKWLVDLETWARHNPWGISDVIMAAHTGWDGERTRGASSLEDHHDSIITLTGNEDGDRFIRVIGRQDNPLEGEHKLIYDRETRRLSLGTGSRKAVSAQRKDEAAKQKILDDQEKDQHYREMLARGVLKITADRPDLNGTEIEYELVNRGVRLRGRGDHRAVLHDLVQHGKVIETAGKRNAKLYRAKIKN